MYRLEIAGSFRGNFKTPTEAMAYVDKHARPFRKSWIIKDSFRKVYAQG
tara:strand:- start:256 stop:402 length:147 start_codon:yes stop_codon:yes gene_type:complete